MNHKAAQAFIFISLLLVFAACNKPEDECCGVVADVVVVKIPPVPDPNLTDAQVWFRFHKFLFPPKRGERDIDPSDYKGGIPNDDSLLLVSLSEEGHITLNSEPQRGVEELRERLSKLFQERSELGISEDGSDQVVKAVGIRMPASAKYADLLHIATGVRDSGADPIVLLIDGNAPLPIR